MVFLFVKHYFFSKRASSLIKTLARICVVGISLSVAAMIVVISVMNGFGGAIARRLLAIEPHIVVSQHQSNIDLQQSLQDYLSRHPLHSSQNFRVDPYELQDVIVRTQEGYYGGAQAKGITSELFQSLAYNIRKARLQPNFVDLNAVEEKSVQLLEGEIAIGVDLAYALGVYEGDEVTLVAPESLLTGTGEAPQFQKVRVKALLRADIPEVDSQTLMYNLESGLKRLRNKSGLQTGVEIRMNDPLQVSEVSQALKSLGYEIQTWEDRNSALFHSLKMEKIVMTLFLSLTLLIASFSIVTVLVLLVTHKRVEIGILRSMGLSGRKTKHIFTGIGLALSSAGVLGGLLLGLGLCAFLMNFDTFKLPDIYYDTKIPVVIDPQMILYLSGGSFLVAALASWLPAKLSSRLNPSESLKTS